MAVDTHNLHHLFSSQLLTSRELSNSTIEIQSSNNNMHMGFISSESGVPAGTGTSYLHITPNSDSGLTFNNTPQVAGVTRKRPHNSGETLSFLGEDFSTFVHQQLLDIDHLVIQHAEKLKMELMERRKRFLKQILGAIGDGMSKRLRIKQEEVERVTRVNWALEERMKSLLVENQLWRELAQSNEATANVLRNNLEHVLAAQVKVKEEQILCVAEAAATADDAESCCCGDNGYEEEKETGKRRRRSCRVCDDGEPAVLLLPCRHLCLCIACGPVVDVCPVCNSSKTGCLFVNMF